MSWLSDWRDERSLRLRAENYVRALAAEPPPDDVRWLAQRAADGDEDHARWELRYARMSIGYFVAQRNALNDRTAAVVARALTESLVSDPRVDGAKVDVAERQLNERMRACADAFRRTDDAAPVTRRLARAMLSFAGKGRPASEAMEREGAAICGRYMAEAAERLGDAFGVAVLPEETPPSEMLGRNSGRR